MALVENYPGLSRLDELCVQTIRFLSMDGVQKANSGHPGMPMGMATAAYTIWMKHLRHNPANPKWINRDRFVLSAGHGSMLLYSLLHLTGYEEVTLDQLKNFRQMGSITPGHPEYGHTPGVEVTTGPLGQGISNSVGMSIAQKYLAARYNKDKFNLFDYNVYVICGDGDLEEGVSSEASSLAGHLGLDNLIVIYDDNSITIDGKTELSFTEDVAERYQAYGWNVVDIQSDGNDMKKLEKAVKNAKKQTKAPTLIKFRSHIAYGSPNMQDTHGAHGSPLGDDEIKLIKEKFGWDPEKTFEVPQEVYDNMRASVENGKKLEDEFEQLFANYAKSYPELAKEIDEARDGRIGINVEELLPDFEAGSSIATRKASGKILSAVMPALPLMLGGSADLTPSNNTKFDGAEDFQKDNCSGRYIRYGVREHAMGAIINGISVSGLVRAYGGTFLVFSDYMRPAVRVASLSHYPSIFVYTHDSIGLGEDGPTHQPVEHLASLRCMPNLLVFRPADANETAAAWKFAVEYTDGPVMMALTRQGLPVMDKAKYGIIEGVSKGGYVLEKVDNPDVLLIATGSEVSVALEAGKKLAEDNIKAQIVSLPCWELFDMQSEEYKQSVIPSSVKARVAVEAGARLGWDRWIGDKGIFIGLDTFGSSAPGKICFEKFGITSENVAAAARKITG
jgi:transketolase